MARIENHPKVILTQEEREILIKAQRIFNDLCVHDDNSYVFNRCDNNESKWYWIDDFIERLGNISEVE